MVSQHVMAAVALSELAAQNNKKEVSTQTEQNLEMWLNFPDSDGKERINTLGTQTDDTRMSDSPNPDSPPNARCSSPWLCSSAETHTADDDILLKPLNLCNDIQTQTPWSVEVEDEDESTQLAHTETQTLLSSFFLDVDCTERQRIVKQNSEEGSTEMFRLVESDR